MSDPVDIVDAKRVLRHRMAALRERECDAGRASKSRDAALIAAILDGVRFERHTIVAGIWPLPGEPDLRPLWHGLHARGHRLVLPETPPPGQALRFRRWHPGCAMLPGRFGTSHPDDDPRGDPMAGSRHPDLLFVPLLAFDARGYRLGHGGGYYDRTLAALPQAHAVGYGFAFQQVEAVPRGPFDLPLPVIVTEAGPVNIER